MNNATERIETLIIGAGQAGLAAAWHLQRRGLPFAIVDADERVGEHWRERWDSLRLYSPARSDALPGMPFPLDPWQYPSGRQMGDYLAEYADRFGIRVRSGTRVARLRQAADGGGFVAETAAGRIRARQVIVANGPFQRPSIPAVAARLDPTIRQLHSSEYRGPDQLQPGRVLVVGLSHSGADIALETAATHPTIVSGRAHGQLPFAVIDTWRAHIVWPVVTFVAAHLLTVRTPIGRKVAVEVRKGGGPLLRVRLPDLDRAGVERHDARTVGVVDGRPALEDGTVLDVRNVIWCTGFRPDFDWIEPPITGDDGWPIQERGVIPSVPGLFVLGVPFTYAFTSMLVAGAGRDAGYVVDRIAERVRATSGSGVPAAAAAPN